MSLHCLPHPPATAGSDSPGQAVEAEEIVKQLDMEQLEETPTSTTTDGRDLTFDPALNPRPLPHVDTTVEEGEIVTEADMPPLTGECLGCFPAVLLPKGDHPHMFSLG